MELLQQEIKSFAIYLMMEGHSSKDVAAALNLNPASVRAWKAWQHKNLKGKRVN